MKTIWKHPIEITDIQSVPMPAGSRLLSVQQQHGEWQGWFEVPNTLAPDAQFRVFVLGTGNPITMDIGRYVCTAQDSKLGAVWHFYTDDGEWS